VAIHSNNSINEIKKFNSLKAKLQGDAAVCLPRTTPTLYRIASQNHIWLTAQTDQCPHESYEHGFSHNGLIEY